MMSEGMYVNSFYYSFPSFSF